MLTLVSLCVEETLEAFTSGAVTAARHVGVNVVVAHTWLARPSRQQWGAVVVVYTCVTRWSCNNVVVIHDYIPFRAA